MRDRSTDEYKQMQVSRSRDQLFRTIAIHQETEDEFSKDTSSCRMIYFYKSHSDAIYR